MQKSKTDFINVVGIGNWIAGQKPSMVTAAITQNIHAIKPLLTKYPDIIERFVAGLILDPESAARTKSLIAHYPRAIDTLFTQFPELPNLILSFMEKNPDVVQKVAGENPQLMQQLTRTFSETAKDSGHKGRF